MTVSRSVPVTEPTLIVLSYFGESWTSGGAVIVDRLLHGYPSDAVVRYCVRLRGGVKRRTLFAERHAAHMPGLFHPWIHRLSVPLLQFAVSRWHARNAASVAREVGAQVAWGIADFMWVTTLRRFMQRTTVPMHLSVHDDPVASASIAGWSAAAVRRVAADFSYCYQNAVSRDVISEGMREYYLASQGVDASVSTDGIEDVSDMESRLLATERRTFPRIGERLIVGHVGNLHYRNEASAFLEAASKAFPGVTVELRVWGGGMNYSWPRLRNVVVVPQRWMPRENLLSGLRECDWAYLPYGFADDRRVFVQTSFPTKLITYLEAGVPVLHHGPSYSSVYRFLLEYPVGCLLDAPYGDALVDQLRHRLPNADLARIAASIREAVARHFDMQQLRARWISNLKSAAFRTASSATVDR